MKTRRILGLLLGCGFAAALPAHDLWLRADGLNLAPGDTLTLHLNVGEDFVPQQELPLVSKEVERFELYHGNAIDNLFDQGHEGATPLWSAVPDFEGEFLVLMTRAMQQVELPNADFRDSLAEEGLSGIAPTARPAQRLHLWRFLKLLGRIGSDDEGSLHHRFLGQQLDLVLIQNPVLQKPGDEQIVQLYFETKPLANQPVLAMHREGDKLTKLTATTDARGVARFKLDQPGTWLVTALMLRPCKKCGDADWEAYLSAFSFELPVS